MKRSSIISIASLLIFILAAAVMIRWQLYIQCLLVFLMLWGNNLQNAAKKEHERELDIETMDKIINDIVKREVKK